MSDYDEYDSDFDSRTAKLEVAARNGDLSQVQVIVEKWPSPKNLKLSLGWALENAVRGGHKSVASYLLDHGATFSFAAAHWASSCPIPEEMFQLGLDHGWNINSQSDFGLPIFATVVQTESLPLIRWFFAHGADPTFRGGCAGVLSAHILDVAASNCSPAVLDLLIEHGLKLEDSDALHTAAGVVEAPPGRIEMMEHLLDLGMDINAIEKEGLPDSTDTGRGTPLHCAVYTENKEHVAFLLKKGANKETKNTLGQTAVDFAKSQKSWRTLELLKTE